MKKSKKKSEAENEVKIEKSIKAQAETIEWQAPEFEHQQKDVSWYWLSLIIGIILLAVSIWQKNFLFTVFIVIAWLVVVYLAGRNPTIWNFKLSEKGIEINLPNNDPASTKFYPYGEIEGFDIHGELILKLKKRFSSYLKINFPAEEEKKIKDFLEKYIAKKDYSESLTDSFSKLIKF